MRKALRPPAAKTGSGAPPPTSGLRARPPTPGLGAPLAELRFEERLRLYRLAKRALAALAVAILILIVLLLVTGTAQPAPATGAASILPSDALAYVHVSTDTSRPAVNRALALTARFPGYPLLRAAFVSRLNALDGGSSTIDLAREVRPWLGKEAALALLSTGGATGSLIVLDVADHARALSFLLEAGARSAYRYGGATLLRYRSGTEVAFVSHYLAIGQDASVRAAIDAGAGRGPSLQSNPSYQRAAAGEPADRVLDAYASAAGVRRLLASRQGVAGALGVLLEQPALLGSTVSVSAVTGGARVRLHSALDSSLSGSSGSSGGFQPTLQSAIPAGSALLLDVNGLERAVPRVLAAAAEGGVAQNFAPLLRRLGTTLSANGVDLQGILSIFGRETAVAITANGRSPALVLVTRTADEDRVKAQLAGLEVPLAQAFPAPASGPGQAPEFNDVAVAGITAHQLSLTPGLQLDYAVFDNLVVVSTSLHGIAAVVNHARPLGSDSSYETTLKDAPQQVSSLLFGDFSQLLSVGEQTGLLHGARYQAMRADLERISAIGLYSTAGQADSTAELFLQIL
ncbi:MAG: DUF3352 domain-containing protein [Actinomycetota bacterium]|nr:DUF3352 domain-containing protein [Actinomycetota bacterium]